MSTQMSLPSGSTPSWGPSASGSSVRSGPTLWLNFVCFSENSALDDSNQALPECLLALAWALLLACLLELIKQAAAMESGSSTSAYPSWSAPLLQAWLCKSASATKRNSQQITSHVPPSHNQPALTSLLLHTKSALQHSALQVDR